MIDFIKNEYLERMKADLGSFYDKYILTFEDKETHGIIINKKKLACSTIDIDYVVKRFSGEIVCENDSFVYMTYDKEELLKSNIQIGKDPLHHAGLYYVQEPSAAKVLCDFKIDKNDAVLDLCASPGGKSIMSLCYLDKKEGGFLLSNEIDYGRSKTLISNIDRMGFDNVIVTCSRSSELKKVFIEFFDKIIVDAPCSGEGMMRKSKDARLQWSETLVKTMSRIQKELLNDAYSMLKKGGYIVYSTCTFSKEEDEEVVKYVLDKFDDIKLLKSEKLLPYEYKGEGQFYAIFRKEGNASDTTSFPSKKFLSSVNFLKYGVEQYEKKYNVTLPTHESTHVDSIIFDNVYELNDDEILKYLHGEEIVTSVELKNSYYKVTYKNLGIGLAKGVGRVLKNYYPKGLRNM